MLTWLTTVHSIPHFKAPGCCVFGLERRKTYASRYSVTRQALWKVLGIRHTLMVDRIAAPKSETTQPYTVRIVGIATLQIPAQVRS